MSLDGHIYLHLIEERRLKPGTIWTLKGNVTPLAELTFLVMFSVLLNSLVYKNVEYGV